MQRTATPLTSVRFRSQPQNQIKLMNILLTGAAGFIGFHISSSLLEKGHEVTGIDNLNNYYDVTLKKNRLNFLVKNKKFVFF